MAWEIVTSSDLCDYRRWFGLACLHPRNKSKEWLKCKEEYCPLTIKEIVIEYSSKGSPLEIKE